MNRKHVFPQDKRSEQQQIDDLLQEIHDEVEIDSHRVDPAQDVADRSVIFNFVIRGANSFFDAN